MHQENLVSEGTNNANDDWFRADELVNVRGKQYPVVGGRLRLAHKSNEKLSISTEIIEHVIGSKAVLKATVQTTRGVFTGYGAADEKRDQRLKDAVLELAETRAIARALRFAGYGVELTGAEEMAHLKDKEE